MKLGLQIVLGLFSLIPVAFAAMGLFAGMASADPAAALSAAVDNQFRYLSGVYILVSLLLWYAIPKIEQHFTLMALICAALFIGGIGRLLSVMAAGPGLPGQTAGAFIELGSPVLLVWLWFVVRKARA
ncbi:MAG: DUF4345 domain-containing protein [Hyphomonas sp.]|jgi:cobalamin synthase|nr:DUF4345 domain-containing protein [Hyphomonas sp.]MDP3458781.1 DUF4345 domain-containing protein [Hyphomonas sp.]